MDRMKVERIIMGPENKIEFTGGSLYFGDHAVDVKSFEVSDFESVIDATDYTDSIIKIITEPMEFTGTIDIKFRGLVKLLGFWSAVKYKVDRLIIQIRKFLHIMSPSWRY